jgi:hypothetical protein
LALQEENKNLPFLMKESKTERKNMKTHAQQKMKML